MTEWRSRWKGGEWNNGEGKNLRKGEGRAGHRRDSDNVVQEGEGLLTIRSKFKAYITCKGKGKKTGSFLTLQTN